jgi:hypothetical protein
MIYYNGIPLIYHRVAIKQEGKWEWASPPYTHQPTAISYIQTYFSHLTEEDVIVISAEDAGTAEKLLEQLNDDVDYRPDEKEQRRMSFIKWLIERGKISEDIPV